MDKTHTTAADTTHKKSNHRSQIETDVVQRDGSMAKLHATNTQRAGHTTWQGSNKSSVVSTSIILNFYISLDYRNSVKR